MHQLGLFDFERILECVVEPAHASPVGRLDHILDSPIDSRKDLTGATAPAWTRSLDAGVTRAVPHERHEWIEETGADEFALLAGGG